MKPSPLCSKLLLLALVLASVPAAAGTGPLNRYLLIIGANDGGPDRARLKYAVSDAERFAEVMVALGGVSPENAIVLKEPRVGELLDALDLLSARLGGTRAGPGRSEAFLYYSGHADEKGLLLGEDRLSYRSLRDRLDEVHADLRIAVLDACASGAFTRLKGGKARPPFLVDDAARMSGHAFLTSSSETESAQESDRIGGSYFTHYLISGVRGAADLSGDGRVTLNEAYQFAFTETLGRTVDTRGGAQHPSYDINLSGAGDIVLTDLRQTTSQLVLSDDLEGRFFVRPPERAPVAELYKSRGRAVELGLEPGSYEIVVEGERDAHMATARLLAGSRVVLEANQFATTPLERTRRRGTEGFSPFAVAGRNRLALRSGVWGNHGNAVTVTGLGFDVFGGLEYTRYLREDLALTVGTTAYGAEAQVDIIGGIAVPVSLRWNPRAGERSRQAWKPFLSIGIVPVTSADSRSYRPGRRTTVGAHFGAGMDLHVTEGFALGLDVGYNAIPELDDPSGLHDNFGGLEVALSLGFLFGNPH